VTSNGTAGRRAGLFSSGSPVGGALVDRLLGLQEIDRTYRRCRSGCGSDSALFFRRALDTLDITPAAAGDTLDNIPSAGPAVVVANHPFGLAETLTLAALLTEIRTDVRFLANPALAGIAEIRDCIIPTDPWGGTKAAAVNARGVRQAVRWARDGGMVVLFPAGEVAHLHLSRGAVVESPWKEGAAVVCRRSGAAVVPVFFPGRNGSLFHVAGLIHPFLRTALLPRQLLKKRGGEVALVIGSAVSPEKIASLGGNREVVDYLRMRTLLLAHRDSNGAARKKTEVTKFHFFKPSAHAPLASPEDPAAMEQEVDGLPACHQLAGSGDKRVLIARASQIPTVLREIGRLREEAFREAGEGTGRVRDLDSYDASYYHLFIWHRRDRSIVGAYRLGATDELAPTANPSGLYAATLFRISPRLLRQLSPALELGRSFIQLRYQKDYDALLLLWKGIGRWVSLRPRYRYLFGPVSISDDYSSVSQRLMMDFLRANNFETDLARYIRAKAPPRRLEGGRLFRNPAAVAGDINEVSRLVSEIEHDGKGVPVLLRQYLKLGGSILGFNRDARFSDVIDALVLVDLLKTDKRMLRRYMGRQESEEFLDACSSGDSHRDRSYRAVG
jgi:putative hemolysin